jgi:hypothetical protein
MRDYSGALRKANVVNAMSLANLDGGHATVLISAELLSKLNS